MERASVTHGTERQRERRPALGKPTLVRFVVARSFAGPVPDHSAVSVSARPFVRRHWPVSSSFPRFYRRAKLRKRDSETPAYVGRPTSFARPFEVNARPVSFSIIQPVSPPVPSAHGRVCCVRRAVDGSLLWVRALSARPALLIVTRLIRVQVFQLGRRIPLTLRGTRVGH